MDFLEMACVSTRSKHGVDMSHCIGNCLQGFHPLNWLFHGHWAHSYHIIADQSLNYLCTLFSLLQSINLTIAILARILSCRNF